jgi:hypothetical protein
MENVYFNLHQGLAVLDGPALAVACCVLNPVPA